MDMICFDSSGQLQIGIYTSTCICILKNKVEEIKNKVRAAIKILYHQGMLKDTVS